MPGWRDSWTPPSIHPEVNSDLVKPLWQVAGKWEEGLQWRLKGEARENGKESVPRGFVESLLVLSGRCYRRACEVSDLFYEEGCARGLLFKVRNGADRIARLALIFLDGPAGRDYAKRAALTLQNQSGIVGFSLLTKIPHGDLLLSPPYFYD